MRVRSPPPASTFRLLAARERLGRTRRSATVTVAHCRGWARVRSSSRIERSYRNVLASRGAWEASSSTSAPAQWFLWRNPPAQRRRPISMGGPRRGGTPTLVRCNQDVEPSRPGHDRTWLSEQERAARDPRHRAAGHRPLADGVRTRVRAVPASVRRERVGHPLASMSEVSEREAGHPYCRGRAAQGLTLESSDAVAIPRPG